MKKINILKDSKEFDRIIKKYKAYKYKDYIIFLERNTNDIFKFGLSVGKKIGNAVRRNKVKRQLKAIISEKDYQNNFNCIIIVGKGINERSFNEMKESLLTAFKNLNIIKEICNEKK
jgi:ribonuclease P protein component